MLLQYYIHNKRCYRQEYMDLDLKKKIEFFFDLKFTQDKIYIK